MKIRSISMVTALLVGVAAPVRFKVRPAGEGSICRVSSNDAGAQGICWCDPQQLANDCTSPNYRYVCAAGPSGTSSTAFRADDAAWALDHPIN